MYIIAINKKLAYWFILIVISLLFTKYYFLLTNEYYEPASSDSISKFEADKVFQKRFLIPFTGKILSDQLGISLDHCLKVISSLSVLFLILGFTSFVNIINPTTVNKYLCFIVLVPVTWNYMIINSIYHAYDIPSLSFYCICLSLFFRKNYILFYFIFIVGTLNRESTCFITISSILIAFEFNKYHENKIYKFTPKSLFLHSSAQFLAWLITTQIINFLISNNPGEIYESTFSMKLFLANMWSGNESWPYLNTDKFFGNPRCFLTLFGGTWIIIPLMWKYINSLNRRYLLLVPIYLTPACLYANLMESRVYHEINIVLSAVIVCCISNFLKNNSKAIKPK